MKKFTTFLFICVVLACHAEPKYRLSICAIFQDEAPYLKEWIEFHKILGVEHFYLYNHRSSDHFLEVLRPYILSGLVELKNQTKVANRIKKFNRLQCQCYTECLRAARGESQWIAFIDIDEFLFPTTAQNLCELLSEYEDCAGIVVNWRIFGTSHIKKIPEGELLIEQLTHCTTKSYTLNRYVKCIIKPECASHFLNPHHPVYLQGNTQVNTDKIPCEGPFFSSYIQTNKLCINHYWTRDEDFFLIKKMPRQKKWGGTPNVQNILRMVNAEKDETILRFIPLLKQAMFEVPR